MTNHIIINNTVPRIRYVSNGILATYCFPFAVFKNSDLKVYFGSEIQSSDTYTVLGVGESEGGTVTLSNIPESGIIITLTRELPIERTTDFQEGGALRANTLNDELDYQIACQQQIADNLNRSMVLPPYAADTNVNLTLPSPSAGKAIVWNSEGTNLENSTVEVNALESTLRGYKESAESASATATIKAGEATTQATTATTQAGIATAKAEEATATLASKANKDMDNVSSIGKERIVSCGMPDFSAGISKSKNVIYQAECDGFIWIHGTQNNTNAAALVLKIGYQSDLSDFKDIGKFYSSPNTHLESSCFIPIPKGMYYEGTDSTGGFEMVFYPVKGEVND